MTSSTGMMPTSIIAEVPLSWNITTINDGRSSATMMTGDKLTITSELPFAAFPPRDPDLACCGESQHAAGACFSSDRRHRYALWRRWNARDPLVMLMLNPSIADELVLDRTVTRCVAFAQRPDIDAGSIEVTNLYPLVSTDPKGLIAQDRDASWDRNAEHILSAARRAGGRVVLGFGVNPDSPHLRYAIARLRSLIDDAQIVPYAFAVTKGGWPGHPLFLRGDSELRRYTEWPL